LSGQVYNPRRWFGNYTSPDNTIGKQFPQEKKLIEQYSFAISKQRYEWYGVCT